MKEYRVLTWNGREFLVLAINAEAAFYKVDKFINPWTDVIRTSTIEEVN